MNRKLIQTVICAASIAIASSVVNAAPPVPTTSEDHFALAKQYQDRASEHRKEAQEHRAMAEEYRNRPMNRAQEARGYQKTPDVVKMEKHCDAIASAAEKLANEEQKAADYHTLRGKELQGK